MQVSNTNLGFKGIIGIQGTYADRSKIAMPIGTQLHERTDITQDNIRFKTFSGSDRSYYVYGNWDNAMMKSGNWGDEDLLLNADVFINANDIINECKKSKISLHDKADEIIIKTEEICQDRTRDLCDVLEM